MSLKEYKEKRDFNVTLEPEPEELNPSEAATNNIRSFVIQKHAARTLHFDFRLEVDGVLKSWAIPKGPSMNPEDKRLAIMVEDHPLEYAAFEGEIPKGEYGGGSVEIWDKGTWEPDKEHQNIKDALEKGVLDFFLHGEKVEGEYLLFRTNYQETKDSWILRKKEDQFATNEEYDARDIPSRK